MAPQSKELDKVERAIVSAREAACKAGLSGESAANHSTDNQQLYRHLQCNRLTSLAYKFEELESAVVATQIQEELNQLDGVEADVVYGTLQAWISAPESLEISAIEDIFKHHGVKAWMTPSTLRRRATRMERPTAPRARRNVDAHRRAWSAAERLKRQNKALFEFRNHHRNRNAEGTEVLFTARALITKSRLILAILLGLPVVMLQLVPAWQFDYWQWVVLGLSTPVVFWSAWPFHRAAIAGLGRGMSALDSASSAAIALAYLFSVYQLLASPAGEKGWTSNQVLLAATWSNPELKASVFFDVACGATILLLIGRLLSRRNQLRSKSLLQVLTVSPTDAVTVVRKDRKSKTVKKQISVGEIRTGDDILVPTGASVPCDCEIISGKSLVDMGPAGGLHRVRELGVGEEIYAGARNHGDQLKCRAIKTGSKTRLASMHRWVWDAARDENRLTQLSTRSASLLVPWALGIAILASVVWWTVSGSVDAAVAVCLSVLATVGPVALAMSTPLPLRLGLWRAATEGALLRATTTIHDLAEVEAVVFNRVGTLTTGPMNVIGLTSAPGENPDLVLRVAAALLMESDHAVSQAIVRADRESRDANTNSTDIPNWLDTGEITITEGGVFEGVVEIPIKGELRHVSARIWRPRGVGELHDPRLVAAVESGGSPIVVSWKGKDRGVINLADNFKDDAPQAIDKLEEMGLETYMLSRDPYPVARHLADSVGISTVLAGIAPNRKAATVRALHAEGVKVAMVGDQDVLGALRVADVGILMGTADSIDRVATDVHNSAKVVLLRDDVEALPELINMMRHVRKTVDWNMWLSWAYNIITLALAAFGLLNPLLATVCMLACSALIEMRSARILKRSYARMLLRDTHARPAWVERINDARDLRRRKKLRMGAAKWATPVVESADRHP